ncbi:protein FATTY ACID EXPORT 1, chloroplastic [Aristolochia californica]|uniref:protein FATTY ACID EXPORT 1, chloroplastic n=1 Tax=Aristolochia californica TaxID=171875 RepID=UPI0035DA546C
METSSAQIHRHLCCRNVFPESRRLNFLKLPIRSVSYGRRRAFCQSISMSIDRSDAETPQTDAIGVTDFKADKSNQQTEAAAKSFPATGEVNGTLGTDASGLVPKRTAKIHDFCFGIPFGGFVLTGGLAGFFISRNPTTLFNGILFGGALLGLSTYSLKVWRQGKSCVPFILGQAAFAAALLWKNLQMYSLTKKLFPTGFFAVVSAAMLCFYTYVMVSGGNPPPKKLKLAASSPS